MQPNRWLALAFVGSALACGVLVSRYTAAPMAATAADVTSQSGAMPTHAGHRKGQASHREEPALGLKNPATASTPDWKVVTGAPASAGNRVLSEAQWRAHAAVVEMEANHELKRLAELLDLDSYQQDKVFSALAQRSHSWLPGMQTGGSNPPVATAGVAAAADVTACLNADQQQTLLQEEMDRQAWWEEILPQLLPPSLSNAGVVTADAGSSPASDTTTLTPPPQTKSFEGD